MKAFTLTCLLAAVVLAAAAPETYTDKFDNINLDEIMENDRLLQGYFNCLVNKGNCTPDASELKSHIAEALQNDCGKCTEAQVKGTRKMIKFLVKEKPEMWADLREVYDKDNVYYNKHKDELESL